MKKLLFTPRPSTRCLVWAKECGLPCIRPFAKGELPMGRMPLLFTAQPLFGWGVKSNMKKDANMYRTTEKAAKKLLHRQA